MAHKVMIDLRRKQSWFKNEQLCCNFDTDADELSAEHIVKGAFGPSH